MATINQSLTEDPVRKLQLEWRHFMGPNQLVYVENSFRTIRLLGVVTKFRLLSYAKELYFPSEYAQNFGSVRSYNCWIAEESNPNLCWNQALEDFTMPANGSKFYFYTCKIPVLQLGNSPAEVIDNRQSVPDHPTESQLCGPANSLESLIDVLTYQPTPQSPLNSTEPHYQPVQRPRYQPYRPAQGTSFSTGRVLDHPSTSANSQPIPLSTGTNNVNHMPPTQSAQGRPNGQPVENPAPGRDSENQDLRM